MATEEIFPMNIIVDESWIEGLKLLVEKDEAEEIGSKYRWATKKGRVKVDVESWGEKSLLAFKGLLEAKVAEGGAAAGSAKLSVGQLEQWLEIRKNPDSTVVTKLENFPAAMKLYVGGSARRWLFEQRGDGNTVPWFVETIDYHPPEKMRSPYVSVQMTAINSGHGRRSYRDESGKTMMIGPHDFRGRTVSRVLQEKGYYLETPSRTASYEAEVNKYLELANRDGFQMSVTGKCYLNKGWGDSGMRTVGQAGRPAKMVVDPPDGEEGASSVVCGFWDDKPEDHLWELPVHPVLEMFDLDEHADYKVHVNNAVPYVYDRKVGSKLVLPKDIKDFIETLVEYSANKFQDIVGGKEGGTIIMLEGPPGTGKTLSAEVYSEVMERPLYKVQSSQLGTSVQKLEEELKTVLRRAERWEAILLIDEADVYIRERGNDIEQNAIVGVFLRVLEYYRGVMFLTTNKGTCVDDAIVSRCTARFRYKNPEPEDQVRLWKVLSAQNGIELPESEIRLVVARMSKLSGRDIKNLLKLAYVASLRKKEPVTAGLITFVERFKQSGDKA